MNRMLRTALVLALCACASLLLSVPASAQSIYGSIFGTVSDSTGAAIPNATVTVTDVSKGTIVTATSNASGDYSVPHLIPDVYNLKVTAKGFKAFEATGISVLADTAPRIDPTLEVGAANTTVTVTADSQPLLKTDRADVATVFDQQQVSSLPVGDQNFTNLQLLLPGAQLLGWSHAADENPQGSRQIQVDGQAFGGTAFELDGTDNQDPILGIIVINPTMDAVTETKITTQNFDAELGKAVSAVVTAQTRSGTNTFHGDIYDFRTGNANLARDPFTQPVNSIPAGLKNRMGGSIGGPIKKDKAFFFFNYEGQRQKVGTSATDTLPTTLATETCLGKEADSQGGNGCDFSDYLNLKDSNGNSTAIIYDTSQTPTLGTDGKLHYPAFPHNIIPRSYIDTGGASGPAVNLLTALEPYVLKGGVALGGPGSLDGLDKNFNESGTGLFNSNQWTERVDYALSQTMHAFERFSRFTDTLSGTVMFGDAGGPGFGINNYGGNSNGANDSLASGMDIAINPKLLTDFRLAYYRYNVIDTKYDQGVSYAQTLGIPGINTGSSFTSGSPGFQFANVSGGGGGTQGYPAYGAGLGINRCNCPLTEREDQFQIVNNWTKIVGNHTFKAGFDLRYGRNLRVPSDTDRAGLLHFDNGPTSDPASENQGGLGFATFMLGQVDQFGRFYSTSTNAKEFQKRTFFFGQDTWRVTHKLTFNYGLRWELYFPETVNAAGNGALLNMSDGYLHVAGIGGIGSNLGWTASKAKTLAPRAGIAYALNEKTVIRAGYGRSFDTGVFGSIFGHTVTQNLPVLGNQAINATTSTGNAFLLNAGPAAPVTLSVPSNGLLPNPGNSVTSSSRHDPLTFPTIDAWNLSIERALTSTTSLTVAYVGNKGTHTLGDGDSNGTNPNEPALNLPGAYSYNGQALHWDPSDGSANPVDAANGASSQTNPLRRYWGHGLTACSDPNYTQPGSGYSNIALPAGACGWTNSIAYRGDDQNTEFDALQITLSHSLQKGLSINANYQWASAFDEQSNYYTWSHSITHGRDTNTRNQQFTVYGSYDLPFGKGKQFATSVNRVTDLLIGGYQLSGTMNLSGGLPFTLTYNEACSNVPSCNGGDAPSVANLAKGAHLHTSLTSFTPGAGGTGTRSYYPAHALGDGTFTNPGLGNFGNAGFNTVRGPKFFTSDLAISKEFPIWETVEAKFRMDAFNAFNHINAGNPGGNIESNGTIGGEAAGCFPNASCGPRQIELSMRLQF